ncbi:MAG: hypothetical protein ACI9CO_000092, partial [Candidatus Azotimanducaceae bacterium]
MQQHVQMLYSHVKAVEKCFSVLSKLAKQISGIF